MIFYYDPIMGLNYYSCHEEVFLIEYAPINLTKKELEKFSEEWLKFQSKCGVSFIDTSIKNVEELSIPIYSNVPYEIF